MARHDIAVVGCGTAGLAVAALLARNGHRVTAFERFEAPRPVGAGLLLQPTGLAGLARLGMADRMLQLGQRIDRLYGETVGGRIVLDVSYRDFDADLHGLGVHRGALFNLLHEAAVDAGAGIATGAEIVFTTLSSGKRRVRTAAGATHGPFDLVIDASGMRSALRRAHAATRLDRPCPYGAVWAVTPLPAGWPSPTQLTQRYDGAHTMLGVLPIGSVAPGGERLAAVFWSLRAGDHAAWRQSGLEAWKDRMVGLWPDVTPFVRPIRDAGDVTFASYADTVLASPFSDRLVHVGDAARVASPQLGQGANLALLDAVTLADALNGSATVMHALQSYAAARATHTRWYGLASRWLTPLFQSDSTIAALARDHLMGPSRHLAWVRREMARTLAGIATSPLTSLEPGAWRPSPERNITSRGRT